MTEQILFLQQLERTYPHGSQLRALRHLIANAVPTAGLSDAQVGGAICATHQLALANGNLGRARTGMEVDRTRLRTQDWPVFSLERAVQERAVGNKLIGLFGLDPTYVERIPVGLAAAIERHSGVPSDFAIRHTSMTLDPSALPDLRPAFDPRFVRRVASVQLIQSLR